ncbi:hypothetical protein RFI_00311, partial [Reticulomyxa filosa]
MKVFVLLELVECFVVNTVYNFCWKQKGNPKQTKKMEQPFRSPNKYFFSTSAALIVLDLYRRQQRKPHAKALSPLDTKELKDVLSTPNKNNTGLPAYLSPKLEYYFQQNLKILDCGCSTGGLSLKLLKHENARVNIVGIDIVREFVQFAQKKQEKEIQKDKRMENCLFICGNAIELLKDQYQTNQFDIGFCILVLHDMPDRWPMNLLCE